jgi:hypothetical protein
VENQIITKALKINDLSAFFFCKNIKKSAFSPYLEGL